MKPYVLIFTLVAIFALATASFLTSGSAAASEPSVMTRVSQRISDLASTSGFSDEDAVSASVFVLEQLIGPKTKDQKLSSHIALSEPEKIKVLVAYDFGIKFYGYEIEFQRGDPNKGMRWAKFVSLRHTPSA